MDYGLINSETNLCENVISLDPEAEWLTPTGYSIELLVPNAGINWSYINGQWIEPLLSEAEFISTEPEAE